ncbi:hypothetical protein Ahy_A03g011272 [Arachis hypogaea]|uniref:Protein FAR1-RELATED SEQUENCE n=1 Tax=Arachis hypogaea TaxID=3818 RepID=A0A445DQ81_ARAHY|nr:hypothetical protein Ahy_A03g011272 [Arachis hypogaea]
MGRCKVQASYEYYEDVVSFDTTYRRNRHGLPFASFVGVNHHEKSSLLDCTLLGSKEIPRFEWVFTQLVRCVGVAPRRIITDQCKAMAGAIRKFVHEYDNVLGNKEQKELEDDAVDSKGVIPCIVSTGIERQFQQEYTSNMFRTLQLEVRKKTHCVVRSIEQKGDTISIKVDEQKVFWGKPVYHTFIVEFDPLSRKGQAQAVLLYMTYRDPQESKPNDGRRDDVELQSDNDHHGSVNKRFEDSTIWNSSDGGGFMHLLNSFRHI